MYSIGTFSKLTKTTIAALRFYDKEGLLKPAYTDSKSGYRYYLSSQLVTVQKILSLRQIDIPIEQIKIMINTNDEQYLDFETKVKITTADAQSFIGVITGFEDELDTESKKTSWNLMSTTAML
jgi:DNA-binding transcriptional MerR regulator